MRRTIATLRLVLLFGLLFGVFGLVVGLPPVDAHASLVASSPTSGQVVGGLFTHVDLVFDEPIMSPDVEVVDPNGELMEVRLVLPVPNHLRIEMVSAVTLNGRYEVTVELISADEDPLFVRLAFDYERGAEPPLPVAGSVIVERSNTSWLRWALVFVLGLGVTAIGVRFVRSWWLLRQITHPRVKLPKQM